MSPKVLQMFEERFKEKMSKIKETILPLPAKVSRCNAMIQKEVHTFY